MNGTSMMVFISMFAAIFGIAYVFRITRHRERIAMIEKGVDASMFVGKNNQLQSLTLKLGMLFVGIALGIIIGSILQFNYNIEVAAAYISMIFLFGGISLIINFLIERKLDHTN